LTSGKAREVEFIQVDVSDAGAVKAAFSAPWPPPSSLLGDSSSATDIASFVPPITVFHIVANIRFYERHLCFLDRSAKVNVGGTKSVLDSAASAGVDVLIYTSSGSVGIRRSRAWLWPWETEPPHFVQALTDDDALSPKCHEEFFSNYAATKMQAEKLVRQADGTPSGKGVLKTGCIRPGNGVFGPGGDILCGAYLVRRTNPTWIANTMHPFVYVENCVGESSCYLDIRSLHARHDVALTEAHLLYEQRLVEVLNRDPNGNDNDHHLPDIGGDCFSISDPNPPHTYKDIYLTLETLTRGECTFPAFSPTLMLLLAHVLEFYYVAWHTLHTTLCVPHALLPPPLTGDIINLQTSLFALTSVHLICDDSRARLPPERGGLGYRGTWTTLQGLCKTVEEHRMAGGIGEERSAKCGGVSFQFFSNVSGLGGLVTRAKRAVADVGRMLSRPSIEVTSQTPDDISPNS
jgi:hypothetical protein